MITRVRKIALAAIAISVGILPAAACSTGPATDGAGRIEELKSAANNEPGKYPPAEMLSHLIPEQMEDELTQEQVIALYKKLEEAYLQGNMKHTKEQLYPVNYYATWRHESLATKVNNLRRVEDFKQNFFNLYEFEGPSFGDVQLDVPEGSDAIARKATVKATFAVTDNSNPTAPVKKECSRTYTFLRTPIPRNAKEETENLRPEAARDDEVTGTANQPLIWRFDEIEDDACADLTAEADMPNV